jgi:hypothetical protein
MITRAQMANYIKASLKLVASLNEAWPFQPTPEGVQAAVDSCSALELRLHPENTSALLSLDTFIQWCMEEPRALVWLPTMHRVAAAELAKHDTVCGLCKVFPIVGLRFVWRLFFLFG